MAVMVMYFPPSLPPSLPPSSLAHNDFLVTRAWGVRDRSHPPPSGGGPKRRVQQSVAESSREPRPGCVVRGRVRQKGVAWIHPDIFVIRKGLCVPG